MTIRKKTVQAAERGSPGEAKRPASTGKGAAGGAAKGANKLRIIGGVWRRHMLPIAPVEGLRPTPDRVRETLFNWLGQDCTGYEVLDLFSGTGALGLEAASRGAARVDMVESNSAIARRLKANSAMLLEKWQPAWGQPPALQVRNEQVEATLRGLHGKYDLIFLDPPFGSDLLKATLPHLKSLLKPAGLIYIEWGQALFEDLPGLASRMNVSDIDALRHLHAGQVHAHLVGLPTL